MSLKPSRDQDEKPLEGIVGDIEEGLAAENTPAVVPEMEQPKEVAQYPGNMQRITIMGAMYLGIFLVTLVRHPFLLMDFGKC